MGKSKKTAWKHRDPTSLLPFPGKGASTEIVNAVIETPGGSRNKFKYDEKTGFFTLSGVLPEGMVFPHAFGFVPSTKAEDGDPEDILILMDEPTFSGCVIQSRLIGVIEAEQTETDGKSERNDRLIAVAAHSRDYSEVSDLDDLNKNMLKEIEQFFVNDNKERGKRFRVLQMARPTTGTQINKEEPAINERNSYSLLAWRPLRLTVCLSRRPLQAKEFCWLIWRGAFYRFGDFTAHRRNRRSSLRGRRSIFDDRRQHSLFWCTAPPLADL